MATVLVTGAGGTGGTATVRTLVETTAHEVVGVDMDPMAAGLYVADESAVVPAATADDWPAEMARVIERFGVDAVVPLVDEELPRIPALRERTDDTAFVLPRQEVVRDTLDKYRLATVLAEHGVATPETGLGTELSKVTANDFPLVVKPRRGRGGEGFAVLDSTGDCERYLAETERRHDQLVVQELVAGTEFTTSVVGTGEELLSVVPKEVIEKRANTRRGVTRRNSAVIASCRDIFDALEPAGPLNVQHIVDEATNAPVVIEINPRFSSTACLTVAAGVNELDLQIRDALGESVTAPEGFTAGRYLLRHTDHTVLDESELLD